MAQPKDINALVDEFQFTIEDDNIPTLKPGDDIQINMGTDAEVEAARIAEEARVAKVSEAERLKIEEEANKGKTPEELKEIAEAAAEVERLRIAEEADKNKPTPVGKTGSYYKKMALKYIEKGKWDTELAVEGDDGNPVLVSDLETIDEDIFFQIEAAIEEEAVTKRATNFISVEGMEDRRKRIMGLVSEGGDLTEIFRSPEEVDEFINPYGDVDLDNEFVQEKIYLQALIQHNSLDKENAQLIVDKAKKELTLDTKVKTYIENYTAKFDRFVEGKTQQAKEAKKTKLTTEKEFKKSLQAEYKTLKIEDKLARRLASSANNVIDGEFEIDNIYAKKMEDSKEAGELILFLTDKNAYLEMMTSNVKLKEQKKTRGLIKLIPSGKTKQKDKTEIKDEEDNDFKFTVTD